jgi:hypothetical protein
VFARSVIDPLELTPSEAPVKVLLSAGQLPILQTPSGAVLGQATAICNYVAKVGGIEGKDANEFAVSQMCMAEGGSFIISRTYEYLSNQCCKYPGEDLYAAMQKNQDTMFVKDKLSAEDLEKVHSIGF